MPFGYVNTQNMLFSSLIYQNLFLDNTDRIRLNRLLSTQQKSPAGRSHADSASPNTAIERKINAETANPILAMINKVFNVLFIIKTSHN